MAPAVLTVPLGLTCHEGLVWPKLHPPLLPELSLEAQPSIRPQTQLTIAFAVCVCCLFDLPRWTVVSFISASLKPQLDASSDSARLRFSGCGVLLTSTS